MEYDTAVKSLITSSLVKLNSLISSERENDKLLFVISIKSPSLIGHAIAIQAISIVTDCDVK